MAGTEQAEDLFQNRWLQLHGIGAKWRWGSQNRLTTRGWERSQTKKKRDCCAHAVASLQSQDTEPARSANLESFLPGDLSSPQPETLDDHYHNTRFSDWGNILFNIAIAAAIADRLVENSEIF